MSLQTIIKQKLETRPANNISILEAMCYSCTESSSDRFIERLNNTLNDDCMGLDSCWFDSKYSNSEFIVKLCEILQISPLIYDTVIDEIQSELILNKQKFKPYIFIETDFKRKNESITVLSALQSNRYIYLDSETSDLSLNGQLETISELVKAHYQEQPVLDVFGEVKRYVYFYKTDITIVFSVDGDVLSATDSYNIPTATMKI